MFGGETSCRPRAINSFDWFAHCDVKHAGVGLLAPLSSRLNKTANFVKQSLLSGFSALVGSGARTVAFARVA